MAMQANRPLPWYKGPKLHPFKFREETQRDITFLNPLGSGLHSEVIRAIIDGAVYAVKLFRFVPPTELIQPNLLREGLVDIDDVINQNDPFHCECRAYGRLKEVGREDLAARCYGYVLLDQLQEQELARRGCVDWDRRPATKDRPIRGIVKEYIPDDGRGPFTYEMLPRMRRDVQELNRLGIVVWDIRTDNYRAGRLVDFSQAHTAPHMELDWNSTIYSRCQVKECCVRDLACFDDMVGQWNYDNPDRIFWHRFLPNPAFTRRLRNRPRRFKDLHLEEGARFDAAFYDWEKKEKDRKRVASRGRVGKQTAPTAPRNGANRGSR